MGALGNEAAKNLALAGVGVLLLLDFDRVEYTNLNRAVLFSDQDVGSPKVAAASRSINRLNRSTKVIAFSQTLQELLERRGKTLHGVDLLIGCLDNREARFILNHFSVAHRIPYVDGGMFNTIGSVHVSVPPYTPCFECGVPQSTYGQIGQRYRCEDIVWEDLTAKQMAVRHPTISTVTSVTAAIQSHEAIKIILGLDLFRSHGIWSEGMGKPIENEIQYDCKTNSLLTQTFHRDPECYVCGTRGPSIDPAKPAILHVSSGERIADILARVQSSLKTREFSLVKGLKPFPDRTGTISEARNLFQRLSHLSRLLAKSALTLPTLQESYRSLHACLDSIAVHTAQDALRSGIPFDPDNLVTAMHVVKDAIGSPSFGSHPFPSELLPRLSEISEGITHILKSVSNDLTVEECGLTDGDLLCAVRHDVGRLHDTVVEVALGHLHDLRVE
jgi:molybdopterin/thiamine biosynthesis adenylyltransferase